MDEVVSDSDYLYVRAIGLGEEIGLSRITIQGIIGIPGNDCLQNV